MAASRLVGRDQVELYEAFKGLKDIPKVARTTPLEVNLGDVEEFWVSDNIDNSNYTIQARLRYIGDHVLMYVDLEVDAETDQADIERSAREFEERIYPHNREIFGEELAPGVDGDPRLTILNTAVRGAGGYFSSADGVVKQVNRFSNEREMFVIGVDSYPIGTPGYASTLAHEFQHMIEWNVAPSSPSWFNEGMSTLAEDLNGFEDHGVAMLHLDEPDIQLTTWGATAAQTGRHYGTSQLFMRYFYEHYAGDHGIAELIAADAGNNLEAFVPIAQRVRPDLESFSDIVADWAVANAINDSSVGDGRYAYRLLPSTVEPTRVRESRRDQTVAQHGADYLALRGPGTFSFEGNQVVSLTGVAPIEGQQMWWSKRGDDSYSSLTREFDLSGLDSATLEFSTWYEIELNWDYAFVTVSTDNGETWNPLQGSLTTEDDPQGNNLGNGITGVSGSPGVETDEGTHGVWLEESMDLTPYAGQKIQLRFWMVHDAAYNAQGILIDNIRIPELNYQDGAEDPNPEGWVAEGFVRTSGSLPQLWELRLITQEGRTTKVEPIEVDAQGRASFTLEGRTNAILMISGATPFTTSPAIYSYTFK
jgi:immune inhibitor A